MSNYKTQEFAEMIGVSVKHYSVGIRKYKKQIEGDEEIAKELQNRNKSNP